MKQAGTLIFFEPAKSKDRIAKDLGYRDAADAGLGSMGIGECIISSDLYNTKDGCNTKAVIPCSTVKFIDSPLYQRFLRKYGIADPRGNPDKPSDLSEATQPEGAEAQVEETMPEVSMPLTSPAIERMDSEPSTAEAQLPQLPETVNDEPEVFDDVPEAVDDASEMVDDIPETVDDVPGSDSLETAEPPVQESIVVEPEETIPETEEPPTATDTEPEAPLRCSLIRNYRSSLLNVLCTGLTRMIHIYNRI